ncbi:MAG: metallophosphoesterase family protein [Clostridia bacterium]|nr:metallophosphoesterase family protein [Clostridia bacterium]
MKKVIAILLGTAMLLQLSIGSTAAYDAPKLEKDEWDMYYESLIEENTLPTLNVGADQTQVNLCWHCDKDKAEAKVEVSTNSDMSDAKTFVGTTTASENDTQLVCRVTVTGLKEKTTYYYRWHTENGWSEAEKYETKSFGDHKALVVGDIQIAEEERPAESEISQINIGRNWNNVLATALTQNPDIAYLVSPGDNTSTGNTVKEWQTLLMPKALRQLPMALAIGNHDKKGMMYNYYTSMPNEYYGNFFAGLDRDFWFRYGDVLYLFYDSTSGNAPDHMAMTKEAVKLNPDAKWRIGVVHHGINGAGDCIGDAETEILLSTIFTPIFDSYDLDLVITGHTHSQGRSHFMKGRKVLSPAESGKTYTDPEGIVYLNSNSVCEKVIMDYEADYLAYSFLENDITTYTTLDFKGNTLILETRRGDTGELLDSVTIERTTAEHNENSFGNVMTRIGYKVIEALGFIYTMIDNLVRKFS